MASASKLQQLLHQELEGSVVNTIGMGASAPWVFLAVAPLSYCNSTEGLKGNIWASVKHFFSFFLFSSKAHVPPSPAQRRTEGSAGGERGSYSTLICSEQTGDGADPPRLGAALNAAPRWHSAGWNYKPGAMPFTLPPAWLAPVLWCNLENRTSQVVRDPQASSSPTSVVCC